MKYFFFKKIYKMLLFLNMNSFLMLPVFLVWYFELESVFLSQNNLIPVYVRHTTILSQP